MTVISSISSLPPLAVARIAATQPAVGTATESPAALSSPASIVTLHQDNNTIDAQTYTSRGVIAEPDAPLAWEYTQPDKVSFRMGGNFASASASARVRGLGETLLLQLAQSNQNISQSVIRSSTGRALEPAELAAAQARMHSGVADNSINLTLKTASGKTVEITLSSQDNALAVQAQVQGGELSQEELAALGAMAKGFESAIQGLTAVPPQLKLEALAQFDTDVFSSVDLTTRFKLDDDSTQSFELHADASQRQVRMSGAAGNFDMSVDLKNAAILGDSNQQSKALASYLRQIEAARVRGDGDQNLLSMFESAFKTVHSNYPQSRADTGLQALTAIKLTDTDRRVLTGLADFSATISEKTVNGNPARPGELDSFKYGLSQATQSKGQDQFNRKVVQNQQSHLTAQYHKPLYAGQKLDLTDDPQSQNYQYYQIDDQASSTSSIGYVKGKLVEASVSHSASQSTRISKYVMGRLDEDTVTPASSSKTQNLLGLLQQALQEDKLAKLGRGTSNAFAALQATVMLVGSPMEIKG
ncbi:MAG: lactate dehydrogenase [Pseudomonas caspiana]